MANYVEKEFFYNLMKDYQSTRSVKAKEKIGKIFIKIASNFLNKPSSINYSKDRKDDMISDAYFMMLKKIDEFDCELYNDPFSYFTSIAKHAIYHNFNMKKLDRQKFVNLSYIDNFEIGGIVE